MLLKSVKAFALYAALLAAGSAAQAASCVFPCSCSVVANPLAFGAYSPATSTPLKVTGSSTVSCTGGSIGLLFNIVVQLSMGSSGTYTQRTMLGPGNAPLGYNVYTASTDTTVFGDGTSGTGTLTYSILLAAGGFNQAVPYYGVIPAGFQATSGTYQDSLTLTVNF